MSYELSFMGEFDVPFPTISTKEVEKFEANELSLAQYILNYVNYSVLHNPFRKFPYFTADNQ